MKTSVSRCAHPALKRLVLALMGAALLSLPLSVSGNPVGPAVRHGQASFARPDAQSLVVTNSPGAIIHWQGFSIGQGELTRFVQQSSRSAVLNRVVAQNPSLILGQLSSNGRVFLINPAGIAVGPGGVVDTAGFVASTLNMTDADFLAGRLRFEGGPGSGAIANAGEIVSRDGGSIVLVGPSIENSGLIRAEGGAVMLAAGQKLEIASLDSPAVRFELQAPQDRAVNLGRIEAAGGAVGVFAGTLRHSGAIRADTVRVDETGTVVLAASKDIVLEPGSLVSASGAPGGVHDGGSVRIVAEDALDLQRGSEVHVDGGPEGGHGGFLELSGKGAIALNGIYTGRAQQPGYRNGTLLIDPANINILAQAAGVMATVDVGFQPGGISLNPEATLYYVVNQGSDSVSVVNAAASSVTDTIPVGSSPFALLKTPDGSKLYVTNRASNTVSVIDTSSRSVVATIPTAAYPYTAALNPSATRLYVIARDANQMEVIDTASNSVIASIPLGFASPHSLSVSANGARVYANDIGSNRIAVIDAATNTVLTQVTVGSNPQATFPSPDGTRVYVLNGPSNSVSVIDAGANTVIDTISVGSHPWTGNFGAGGVRLYVGNRDSNNVSVIDTATRTVIGTIPVGSGPYSLPMNSDRTRMFAVNRGSSDVTVIDTGSGSVVATIPVGANPTGFAMVPDGSRAFVSNTGSTTVSVVSLATDTTTGGVVAPGDSPGATLNIAVPALRGAWTDVTLAATNDISVLSPVGSGDIPAGGSLTLEAGHDVNVNAEIGNQTVRFDHDLTLRAGNRVGVNAPIYLNDNTLTAKAGTISIDARVDVGGTGKLVLDAVTGSSQSAPIVAGTLDLRGATAVHTLLDPGNQVSVLKPNTGQVSLASNGSVVVAGTELAGLGTETIILAPAVASTFMGNRIAVSGDVMIVGASSENSGAGAAYVYRWNGAAWVFEQRLVSPDPPDGDGLADGFGGALAVEGNLVVVGAAWHSEPGFQRAGAAYTWRFDGTSWSYTGKLSFTERVFETTFGNSLDIDNGRLVVAGLGRTSEGGFWTGKVWFYDYVGGAGTGWVERGNARQSDVQANDYFGYSLDIDGNRMIVGAFMATPLGTTGNGKAYVFEFNPATRQWVQTQRLTASNPQGNAHFGMDVSISGDVAVIGAGNYDGAGLADTGAAYVFRYNGATWTQEQFLTRAGAVPVDLFGYRVAATGGGVTVGGYGVDAGGTTNAGAAYLYTHDGTQWSLARELTASNRVANDAFGIDVFADARAVYVGAYARDQGPVSNTGAVYTFDASPVAFVAQGMTVTATGDLTQTGKVQSGGPVRYQAQSIAINNLLNAGTSFVVLTGTTNVSQTAPITAAGLRMAGPTATFELTDMGNAIGQIAGVGAAVDFRTSGNIHIGSVDGLPGFGTTGVTSLTARGTISQSNVLSAAGLELLGPSADVVLTFPGNLIPTMAANVRSIEYASANPVEIAVVGGTNGITAFGDISVRVEGGADLRVSAPVTNAGATGAIDLIADRSIIVGNGASIGSSVSPTTITLNADRDGTGGGNIRITGATLRSLGSDIVLGGGAAPATTPARGLAGTGPETVGVLLDGTSIEDAGTVRIAGEGGAGTGSAHGVQMTGAVIRNSGDIALTGTGGSGGSGNYGLLLSGNTRVEAAGPATVTVTGTGGTGTNTNTGVVMTSGARLTTDDGALSVTGTGRGSGASNLGVYMEGGSRIESVGSGALTVTGQGSTSAANDNEGVFLRDTGTQIYTVNAALTVRGTGGGTGINNSGVVLWQGAAIQSDGSGAILIEGTGAGTSGTGIWTGVGSNLIGGPSSIGPLTLIATGAGTDAIVLRDVDVMAGGTLTLQPGNPAASIGLAGEPGDFNLDLTDLDNIWSFQQFVIGRPDGTGTLRIGTPPGTTESDGRAVSGTGDIVVAGALDFGTYALSFSTGGNISQQAPITASEVILERGTWWSSSTVTGNFVNQGGTVQPGASPGVFTILGNYTQAPAGVLVIELGGAAPGQYDQLVVSGTASLGGTMRVSMFGGFTDARGLQFEPIRYASASGAFSSVSLPAGFDFTFGDHGIHFGVDLAGIPPVIPTLPAEIAAAIVMPEVLGLETSFEEFALDPWFAGDLLWGYGEEESVEGIDVTTGELTPLPAEIRRRGTTCF